MAKPVLASFKTSDLDFPAGTVASAFLAALTEATSGAVLHASIPYATAPDADGNRVITFDDVPAGSYTLTLAVTGADGMPLAAPLAADAPVVVAAAGTVSIAVPSSVGATQP